MTHSKSKWVRGLVAVLALGLLLFSAGSASARRVNVAITWQTGTHFPGEDTAHYLDCGSPGGIVSTSFWAWNPAQENQMFMELDIWLQVKGTNGITGAAEWQTLRHNHRRTPLARHKSKSFIRASMDLGPRPDLQGQEFRQWFRVKWRKDRRHRRDKTLYGGAGYTESCVAPDEGAGQCVQFCEPRIAARASLDADRKP